MYVCVCVCALSIQIYNSVQPCLMNMTDQSEYLL